jgi:hypothetical protein
MVGGAAVGDPVVGGKGGVGRGIVYPEVVGAADYGQDRAR